MLKHKGYIGSAEYSAEDRVFHGRLLGIADVVNYEATTVDELEREFRDSVEDYLEFCKQRKKKPEKPVSGKFSLRLGAELHRWAVARAETEGKSLNSYIADLVRRDMDAA